MDTLAVGAFSYTGTCPWHLFHSFTLHIFSTCKMHIVMLGLGETAENEALFVHRAVAQGQTTSPPGPASVVVWCRDCEVRGWPRVLGLGVVGDGFSMEVVFKGDLRAKKELAR